MPGRAGKRFRAGAAANTLAIPSVLRGWQLVRGRYLLRALEDQADL